MLRLPQQQSVIYHTSHNTVLILKFFRGAENQQCNTLLIEILNLDVFVLNKLAKSMIALSNNPKEGEGKVLNKKMNLNFVSAI